MIGASYYSPNSDSPSNHLPEDEARQQQQQQQATAAPCVSVIIPAYNVAAYIAETLDSVLAQTFTDYEIIVVNDGSPDTPEFEQALAPYREQVVYIVQPNGGPSSARNRAIRHARGEYVALLDSDDTLMPTYLEEQIRLLRADPGLDMVYADGLLFGDSLLAGRTFMDASPSRGPVTLESLLKEECVVFTSGTVARRKQLIALGLFDERYFRSEDFDLWLRLVHGGGRIAYQSRVLARHRLRDGSLAADSILMDEGLIEVLTNLKQRLTFSCEQQQLIEALIARRQAQIALQRGKNLFVAREYERAAELIERAHTFHPSRRLQAILFGLRVAPGLLHRVYRTRQRHPLAKEA